MLVAAAFIAVMLSCVVQAMLLLTGKTEKDWFTWIPLLGAGLLLAVEIGVRSAAIGMLSVTGTFEALILFSASTALLLCLFRLLTRRDPFPAVLFFGSIIVFILLSLAVSPLIPKSVRPPLPALRSGWLALHVSLAFLGEAFFAVAFVAAVAFFLVKTKEDRDHLDRLVYRLILIGYPVYTAGGLIFGAVWAWFSWGSFWSWDPKEIWALVTWVVYTLYLHSRLVKKWQGKVSSLIAVIGFLIAMFTFLGVSYLFRSLHSYV